jgi:aspartate racemase
MKTVGVIGGMGPKATIDYLDKVVLLTPAAKDQEHIKMIIFMNPQIPDRTEAIVENKKDIVTALVESARLLENSGVDFITIPCVTAHFWLEEIKNSVKTPILSMIEASLKKVREQAIKANNIGILATTGAIQTKIFDKVFELAGLNIIAPDNEIQENYVMQGVYDIKKGEDPEKLKSLFLNASQGLIENSAQVIIAACTEIPLCLKSSDISVPLIDISEALAEETVAFAFE